MVASFSNTEQSAASIPELAPMLARASLASIGRCRVAVTKSTDDRSLLRLSCVMARVLRTSVSLGRESTAGDRRTRRGHAKAR